MLGIAASRRGYSVSLLDVRARATAFIFEKHDRKLYSLGDWSRVAGSAKRLPGKRYFSRNISYDFSKAIDRKGTNSLKYDKYLKKDGSYEESFFPLWVADTDFETAPHIKKAIMDRVNLGHLGYPSVTSKDMDAIQRYLEKRHALKISHEDITVLPSLVSILSIMAKLAKSEDVSIITFTPIYPPFLIFPHVERCKLDAIPLVLEGSKYSVDLRSFEAAAKINPGAYFLFCNPHNPIGKVYSEDELKEIAGICKRYKLKVCSDEVHSDLVFGKEKKHLSFSKIFGDENLVTLMGPGKTFNLTGLGSAFMFSKDKQLMKKIHGQKRGILPDLNLLGLTAMTEAYRNEEESEVYRRDLLDYIKGNYEFLKGKLGDAIEYEMDATFLLWINASKLKTKFKEEIEFRNGNPAQEIWDKFKVGLNEGSTFGGEKYKDYVRLNFACPRSKLEAALQAMMN